MTIPLIGYACTAVAALNSLLLASNLMLTKAAAASEAEQVVVAPRSSMQRPRQLLEA